MATKTKRWTRAEARVVVDELEASGLSMVAFSRGRALSSERIRKWRARFRQEAATQAPRLVELVVHPPELVAHPPELAATLAVRCPSGHSVELQGVAALVNHHPSNPPEHFAAERVVSGVRTPVLSFHRTARAALRPLSPRFTESAAASALHPIGITFAKRKRVAKSRSLCGTANVEWMRRAAQRR